MTEPASVTPSAVCTEGKRRGERERGGGGWGSETMEKMAMTEPASVTASAVCTEGKRRGERERGEGDGDLRLWRRWR